MDDKLYWNGNGKFQKEFDLLGELIPDEGSSKYMETELAIALNGIYYDFFNNGFGNYWKDNLKFIKKHYNNIFKEAGLKELTKYADQKIYKGPYNVMESLLENMVNVSMKYLVDKGCVDSDSVKVNKLTIATETIMDIYNELNGGK